jgi:hypothetical protein
MKQVFTLLFVLASFNCFSQQKEKDPIIGMDKKAVIKQYGQPTTIKKEGAKGEVLIYEKKTEHASRNTLQTSTRVYTFSINKEGKVYAWEARPAFQPAAQVVAW